MGISTGSLDEELHEMDAQPASIMEILRYARKEMWIIIIGVVSPFQHFFLLKFTHFPVFGIGPRYFMASFFSHLWSPFPHTQ